MNGVHDMGGMHCFGPVQPETGEPVFHADWERRALAVTLAVGQLGRWNIDQSRSERESLPPALYLTSSYYKIWIEALERSMATVGLLDGSHDGTAKTWAQTVPTLISGSPYRRETDRSARFAVGDRVRTRNSNPAGHTRLPRYARGKTGTVVRVHGAHVFADRNAVPLGERPEKTPEWLYTVDFAGTELWGAGTDPDLVVSIEAWEPYLLPAAT